ncbi:Chloroperoxidase [Labilithrix luteola]|uniref:Chloroperoxidase n=1 Tax=Labilithrix luteola TaxID=1391654 RepID=A0A0K1PXI8_9BACT|nr:alpha/beta hydrolase [Labilithrix luteola]AKU97859.1 Chloroperoxidase [Labilithrix luteola]
MLVHGGLSNHLCWQRQVDDERLASFRIVTYDLRGHGDSDKPVDPSSYQDEERWADDLHAVLETCGLRDPVLVVWSLAGVVTSAYLRKYGGSRLGGVVWVGAIPTVAAVTESAVFELMPRMFSPHIDERIDGLRAWLASCFGHSAPPSYMFERMLASASFALPLAPAVGSFTVADPWPTLRAFDRPALVIQGTHDRITPPDVGRQLAENIPNATLVMYDGAGHALFIDEPDRFASDILAFVRRT